MQDSMPSRDVLTGEEFFHRLDDVVNAVTAVLGEPRFGAAAAAGLIAVGLLVFIVLWLARTAPAEAAVRAAARRIAAAQEQIEVITEFSDMDRTLRSIPALAPAWEEFRGTLIIPEAGSGDPIRTTIRPSAYLTLQAAEAAGLPLSTQRLVPEALLGTGLVLTLLGLVSSLLAGEGVPVADQAPLPLATIAAHALPGVAGLLMALVLGLADRLLVGRLRTGLDRLCTAIERRMPPLTPQAMAAAHFRQIKGQMLQAERVTRDMSSSLARTMDQTLRDLPAAVAEALSPLTRSLANVGESLAEANRTALREAAAEARASLTAAGGESLAGLADVAERTRSSLASLAEALDAVEVDLPTRLTEITARLDRITGQGTTMEADLDRLAAAWRERLEASLDALDKEMERAGSGVATRLASASAEADAAIRPLVERLAGMEASLAEAGDAATRHSGAVANAAARCASESEALAEAVAGLRGDAGCLSDTARRLATAADGMEAAAGALIAARAEIESLADAVGEQAGAVVAAWESQRDHLGRIDTELASALERLVEGIATYRSSVEAFAADYGDASRRTASGLSERGGELRGALDELTRMMDTPPGR